jgi:iron complex transport system ATP-binding protein
VTGVRGRLVSDRHRQPAPVAAKAVALHARDLGVQVEGRWLLRDVNLDVVAGQVLAVIGPNGAGKSTLLSLLAGDVRPSTGTVRLAGLPVARARPVELARRRAVLPQQPWLSFPFTVGEVVAMGRAPWAGTDAEDDDESVIAEAMATADVADLVARRFPTLSGGEQARASFARILAQHTGVLLLDEPTAALDLRHQEQTMTAVAECARAGLAVLAVVHDIGLAAAYADQIAVIDHGQLVAHGAPEVVLTEPLLEQVYQVPVEVLPHPTSDGLIITPRRAPSRARRGETR